MKSVIGLGIGVMFGRPPRRGTWIEIKGALLESITVMVVPRVGGRGLKLPVIGLGIGVMLSSPA